MRSFHATEEAGSDSTCESLGFSTGQVDVFCSFLSALCCFFGLYFSACLCCLRDMKHILFLLQAIQDFFCKNCQYKQHQCFSCGELGSSDKLSGAEV